MITASTLGYIDIVSLLIQRGAQLDLRDERGCTALWKASEEGNADIVTLLLNNGANPLLKGFTDHLKHKNLFPVEIARLNGYPRVADILEKGGNRFTIIGGTPTGTVVIKKDETNSPPFSPRSPIASRKAVDPKPKLSIANLSRASSSRASSSIEPRITSSVEPISSSNAFEKLRVEFETLKVSWEELQTHRKDEMSHTLSLQERELSTISQSVILQDRVASLLGGVGQPSENLTPADLHSLSSTELRRLLRAYQQSAAIITQILNQRNSSSN